MARKGNSEEVSEASEETNGNERDRALGELRKQLSKEFGEGSFIRLGERKHLDVPVFSTGSLMLDMALGVWGFPRGRIVEVFGPEASGKTTLCLSAAASVQAGGGQVAFIDTEHALDPKWAATIGVNVKDLFISQPDCGEDALGICERVVKSHAIDMVIIDSVAALVPRAELEGNMGDSHVGLQARLMAQAMRKLAGAVSQSNCALIFTNQIREKIGVMFGNPETTTGGNALKFAASMRLNTRCSDMLKEGEAVVGRLHKVKVVKNKLAAPFREAEVEIYSEAVAGHKKGVSWANSVVAAAEKMQVIEKRGAWYSYAQEQLGQGRAAAGACLENNVELCAKIAAEVREKYETQD